MENAQKTVGVDPCRPCQVSPLLSYPDEILLIILEYLSTCDLFALATLCRRLHFIALPMYYQLHNVSFSSPRELLLDDQDSFNALPGLLISLSPKTFCRLHCTFPSDESAFLASARRLRALVTQLTHLAEVVFEFRPIEAEYPELEPLSWRQPLEKLMAAVAASECNFITIRGDLTSQPWLLHSQVIRPSSSGSPTATKASRLISKFRKGYKTTKRLCKGGKRNSRCAPPPEMQSTATAEDVTAVPSLHTVNISSAMFFFRIVPRFTVQTLNLAPITTLDLSNIRYHISRDWSDVLASIHMPLLQNLTIKSCAITFGTLSHILSRHPRITTLTIDALEHDWADHWLPIGISTRAPNLTSLTAPVPYIPQFLTHAQVAPKLDNLTILAADVCGRNGLSTEFARVWWGVLDDVAERVNSSRLGLDITLPYCSGFNHVPAVTAAGENTSRRYLAMMERLVIRSGECGEYLMRENWAGFREWLECFPALVELEIGDVEGGGSAGGGGGGVLTNEKERRAFVHEMMPVFARIAMVKLDGQNLW